MHMEIHRIVQIIMVNVKTVLVSLVVFSSSVMDSKDRSVKMWCSDVECIWAASVL